ncbi:MAG: class I SAM-dependent methyltransferase [Acidimicrobiales bacterium]
MTFYEADAGAERIAAAYDQRLVPWLFEPWAEQLVAIADPVPSAQALDLACGTGLLTRVLLGRLGVDGHVHGVDADPSMLTYASRRIRDRRVSWHQADATRIPIKASTLDLVVCNQGMQFFPDSTTVLAEISRVLRPGGSLCIGVWGRLEDNPWPKAMSRALGDELGDDARRASESVCGLGDPVQVHRLVSGAGFHDVKAEEVQLTATHPDAREAIDGQLAALPSAATIDALGLPTRDRIIDAMVHSLREWTDVHGALAVPSSCVLATATSPV